MKKTKILFFNHACSIGGAGLSFLDILKSIDKTKYEVVVYNSSLKSQQVLWNNRKVRREK